MCKPGIKLAIANPEGVCVGVEIIEKNLSEDELRQFRKNLSNYTESCDKTASVIALKTVDAVIGWSVFQYWNPEMIETVPLKAEEIVRIGYIPIAVATYTKDKALAQQFIDYVRGENGKMFFKKYNYFSTSEDAEVYIGISKPVGGEYLGPSGSGKTLLLETIAGLTNHTSGAILLDGKDVTTFSPEKRNLSYLPQDNTLFPHKNVFQNIAYGLTLKKKLPAQEIQHRILKIAEILEITNLLERSIANLSGGEQQRVALARALVLQNKILLLDEPTSSLHETMQENFCLMLNEIKQKFNLTVLMATHHKDSAFMLADSLHFIENGSLLFSSKTSTFFHQPIPLSVANIMGMSKYILND